MVMKALTRCGLMRTVTLALGLLWWPASPVGADDARRPEPVDQTVSDMDPLAQSLRRVETGLRADGEQTSLFAVPDGAASRALRATPAAPLSSDHYYRVGPGFVAQLDRPAYLVRVGRKGVALNRAPRRDGEVIELAPANTVFLLALPDALLPSTRVPDAPLPGAGDGDSPDSPMAQAPAATKLGAVPQRVNTRLDLRVRARLNGRVEARRTGGVIRPRPPAASRFALPVNIPGIPSAPGVRTTPGAPRPSEGGA